MSRIAHHITSFSSASTLTKTTSLYTSANFANLGLIFTAGVHHVQVKSTTTSLPPAAMSSSSKSAFVSNCFTILRPRVLIAVEIACVLFAATPVQFHGCCFSLQQKWLQGCCNHYVDCRNDCVGLITQNKSSRRRN
jgi:hypothetical protein